MPDPRPHPWRRLARERVLALGLPARQEADLIEELAGQMEEIHTDALAAGLTREEAERRAVASLPPAPPLSAPPPPAQLSRNAVALPPAHFGEQRRGARSASLGGQAPALPLDLEWAPRRRWLPYFSSAWRSYARQPWFLAAAVLAIGVGIGASVTIFSLLDAVVLRPLPYRAPHELVMVWEHFRNGSDNVVSPANYVVWRSRTSALAASSPVISMTRNLVGVGEPMEVGIEAVAWNYLRLLGGVQLALGRDFMEDDDRPDTPAALLLSHRLWSGKFGADPGVVGRRLELDGMAAIVVGVLPPGFHSLSEDPDMLTTARLDAAVDYRGRGRFMRLVARVPDVARAQRDLGRIAEQLAAERPDFNQGWGVRVAPLAEHFSQRARASLWMLMAAVALVLLIVCGNVANLLLARLAARQRDLATRYALGATPTQLALGTLQESLLLAALGGGLGLALAWAGVAWLRGLTDVPRLADAALDARVALFALAVTTAAALLFGAAPAWTASRWPLARPRRGLWSNAFVIAQVALTLTLLLGAVSLVQQLRAALAADPGFDPTRLVTLSLALPAARDARGFFAELETRLRHSPEVEQVGAVAWLPLAGPGAATTVAVEGRPLPRPGEFVTADVRIATPAYFPAMRIPVLAGQLPPDAAQPEQNHLGQTPQSQTQGSRSEQGQSQLSRPELSQHLVSPTQQNQRHPLPPPQTNRAQHTEPPPSQTPLTQAQTTRNAQPGAQPSTPQPRQDGLIVSATLAQALFPDARDRQGFARLLGQRLRVNMRDYDAPRPIVAIVGDVRHASLEAPPRPTVYYQHSDFALPAMTVVIRPRPDAALGGLASAAVALVRQLDPHQPVRALRTMDEWIGRSLAERRLVASACGAFAVTGLVLACMGVYGAFSRWVESRRQELGVRLALGADSRDVLALLARHAAGVLTLGLALGLLLWIWPSRVWALSPSAPVLMMTLFAFVSLSAAAFVGPARRALQTDPLVVLRQE